MNRVYGARWNPLYHSGAITIALLGVLIATGVYLLVFYRLGAPHASVMAIQSQAWAGRWIRALHRFASDAALVAAAVHAFRMYAQRRTWGPRALAWTSGVVLVGVFLAAGWSGYVLVWDEQAQVLAMEGARLLDALPLFSEPIGRAFTGERSLPSAFFFLTLFAHIALPIGLGALMWVHVARVSRPVLLPARPLLIGVVLALFLLSLTWPLPRTPAADLLRVPGSIDLDWFFGFWLPVTQRMPAWSVWAAGLAMSALVLGVPWLTRPALHALPAPAVVDARRCTGCEQCVRDCPYEAIEMVARQDGRATLVAQVQTELCTNCGICVGSCPPMAIGARGVSGRDQLTDVRLLLATERPGTQDVVIVGCEWSAARSAAAACGALFMPVPCVGAMHSSVVELLLRGGAGGVLVAGCVSHDGRTREGVAWTNERLHDGRAADLKQRVDHARVRLVEASLGEQARMHAAALAFAAEIDALGRANPPDGSDSELDVVSLCLARSGAPADEDEPLRSGEG